MRWLVVLSCVLVATSASAEQRLVVGESTRGVFYWHGHRIAPPYTIEVGYEVGPETTWTATYLNGRPIEHHEPPAPPAVDFADPTLAPDQQALERIATRHFRSDMERGYSLRERIVRMAEILRSERALVDSVLGPPAGDLSIDAMTVYWRGGSPHGSRHGWDPWPAPTSADWWRQGQESARRLVHILSGGTSVVWSWSRIYLPRPPGQLDEEIERYRAGENDALPDIRDKRVLAELRSPPPQSDLVAQLSPRPWSPPPCGLPRAVAQSEARHVALETIASSDALVLAGGRELGPPFELAAECVADPDTTWMTLTVNGELAWRRPSEPVNWIVQRGAPCGRPPDFGMLSLVLRSGGLAILAADTSIYVPRVRRPEYAAVVDSLRAATGAPLAH